MKAFILSLFFAFTAFADDTNRTFYVRVIVAGVETNSVSSSVKRELRGLRDVNLTDINYRTTLSIVVAPLKETKAEVIRGYVASWAVAIREGDRDILHYHTVQIGNTLRGLAETIATRFDADCLEPSRQAIDELPVPKPK